MRKETKAYKADAGEAAERMRDWWAGRRTDRVAAHVTAPREGVVRRSRRGSLEERLTDFDTIAHNVEAGFEATYWGGEAFPSYWVFPIAVPMGVYLGCEPQFQEGTTWQKPLFETWDPDQTVSFDPTNKWWRLVCGLTRALVERADRRYGVSGCGICGIADVMANLWGSETLLLAMSEDPEGVIARRDRMIGIFREMYDRLYEIVAPHQDGYFDWHRLWAPGRVCTLQNDLSCMLSPAMFEKLWLEEIRQEARHIDYAFYHLDGPGAVRHLDALLALPELDGIQWVPGAGASPDPLDWISLYRKVQEQGKKLSIACPPERAEPLLRSISRRGVFLRIGCPSETLAREVLARLEKIGT